MNDWFNKKIQIFGIEKKRTFWLLISLFLAIIIGIYFLSFLVISGTSNFLYHTLWITVGILALLLIYITVRSILSNFQLFIIFALCLSAIAFVTDKYFFPNEIFPSFSTRTIISLWFSFTFLFISVFYKKIPIVYLTILPGILFFGIFICLAFAIISLPMMAFGWIMIPFFGLGFLPYSPLIAGAAFALSLNRINNHLKEKSDSKHYTYSTILLALSILLITSYSSWYFWEWRNCKTITTKETQSDIGHEKITNDLPKWIKIGSKLPINHVSEAYLQPLESRNFLFQSGKIFDPLAYLSSLIFDEKNLKRQQKERLLMLLFGYTHTGLERLWSGHSLITNSIQSHIQIYPEAKLAYTETTLNIFNESDRQQEAIYTLQLPQGSVATKLSLWINGIEQPGRLTFRSTAKNAYKTIVGVERRDPSLLEWLDGGRLRLRVFPIFGKKSRTVRFGIISPLKSHEDQLVLEGIRLQGPPVVGAKHKVHLDIFGQNQKLIINSKNITLQEKVVSDGEVKQLTSHEDYQKDWKINIEKPKTFSGVAVLDNYKYSLQNINMKKETFIPSNIYLLLNKELSKEKWKAIYSKIFELKKEQTKTYIVSDEKFYTSSIEKGLQFIEQTKLPRFNLFPFYTLQEDNNLFIIAGEEYSLPIGEIISTSEIVLSNFQKQTQQFFAKNQKPILVASVNGKYSSYIDGLAEFKQIVKLSSSENELRNILKNSEVRIPEYTNANLVNIQSFFQIKREASFEKNSGPDLIIRLFYYREILNKLENRYFQEDTDNSDLIRIAQDGSVVTPITSLIVLESEKDYDRFGIRKESSKLGQSSITKPGLVPEPEEWMLIIFCIIILLYWYKKDLKRFWLEKLHNL